jgi:hypothetical protein
MCSALDSLTELCGALNTNMAGHDANTQKELLKMPTKPILARRGSLPNFMLVSNMKRHGSLPDNMHSLIDARRWDSREPHNTTMEGYCVIKSSPNEYKEMQVLMKLENDKLSMELEQQNKGRWHSFQLCTLTAHELEISYSLSDTRGFFVATPWKGRLEGSIYCRPADNNINGWLLLLQKAGARVRVQTKK